MMTATPINNRLLDLQHLIEHFTNRQAAYFKNTLGNHSLPGHFRKLEIDPSKRLSTELEKAGIKGIDQIDSATKRSRGDVIRQFAPYYNGMTSQALADKNKVETRVLITTDVLSKGLNLQDATCASCTRLLKTT